MDFTMDRNRSGSPASICLASHAPGSTLSFTAIAFFSFDLDVAITKDHAMAVLISRRHVSTSGNSYTTPVDATPGGDGRRTVSRTSPGRPAGPPPGERPANPSPESLPEAR